MTTPHLDARPAAPPAAGPLAGLRVLELGQLLAGPFAGTLLAYFGAEVIKVEPPEGDPIRQWRVVRDGTSLWWRSLGRNKKCVTVDLKTDEGRALVGRLAERCDVLIENFRPGTLEKWGIGYEALKTENPGLVMVRISGFGQSGPYRERPGYGFLGDAVGGMLHINGYPDRPPVRAAVPVTDMVTALYGALGAVMALLARGRTGQGQVVDAALYESAFSLMEAHVPAYQKLGHVAMRAGSHLPGSTPNSLYPTADGGTIAMAASSDAVFRRLAAVMDRPELADDPRYATALARVQNEETLDALIADWTSGHTLDDLVPLLHERDVPASRVFTMADIFRDPHFAARGTIAQVPDDALGTVAMPAPAPRLSATPGAIRHTGGEVGADTVAVLRGVGGLSAAQIDALLASGAAFDLHHGPAAKAPASATATSTAPHAA